MASSDYEASEDFTLDLVDEVPCPKCDDSLRVPKDYSGKIMCPNCEWKFQFPLPPEVNRGEVREDTRFDSWGNFFLDFLWGILARIVAYIIFGIILLLLYIHGFPL